MTYLDSDSYLTVANLLICCLIGLISICRLRQEICTVDRLVRSRYAIFVGGATACGWQPLLFGTNASIGTLVISGTLLLSMVIDFIRWKKLGGTNGTCPLY